MLGNINSGKLLLPKVETVLVVQIGLLTENAANLLSFRRIDRPSHHVAGVR